MRFRLDVDGERREIEVEPTAGGFVIRIDGATYRPGRGPARNSSTFESARNTIGFESRETRRSLAMKSTVYGSRTSPKNPAVRSKVGRPAGRGRGDSLTDAWPRREGGRRRGFSSRRGQTLVILEAMKMQNEIPAPGDGVVRQVAVAEGETITADRVVASIELGAPSAS